MAILVQIQNLDPTARQELPAKKQVIPGQPLRMKIQPGMRLEISVDGVKQSGKAQNLGADQLRLKRVGAHLHVVDEQGQTLSELLDFFEVSGVTLAGQDPTFVIQCRLVDELWLRHAGYLGPGLGYHSMTRGSATSSKMNDAGVVVAKSRFKNHGGLQNPSVLFKDGLHQFVLSLRAKRGNASNVARLAAYGSPRRCAPRDDEVLQTFPNGDLTGIERKKAHAGVSGFRLDGQPCSDC
jgi:hypothetical protein